MSSGMMEKSQTLVFSRIRSGREDLGKGENLE